MTFSTRQAEAAWDRHNATLLNNFLAQEDQAVQRADRIEAATERHLNELIADPAAVVEAAQESFWEAPVQAALVEAFHQEGDAKLAAIVRESITNYLKSLAQKAAEKEEDAE